MTTASVVVLYQFLLSLLLLFVRPPFRPLLLLSLTTKRRYIFAIDANAAIAVAAAAPAGDGTLGVAGADVELVLVLPLLPLQVLMLGAGVAVAADAAGVDAARYCSGYSLRWLPSLSARQKQFGFSSLLLNKTR